MTKKRRRTNSSFWIDTLQQSTGAKRLRRSAQVSEGHDKRTAISTQYEIGSGDNRTSSHRDLNISDNVPSPTTSHGYPNITTDPVPLRDDANQKPCSINIDSPGSMSETSKLSGQKQVQSGVYPDLDETWEVEGAERDGSSEEEHGFTEFQPEEVDCWQDPIARNCSQINEFYYGPAWMSPHSDRDDDNEQREKSTHKNEDAVLKHTDSTDSDSVDVIAVETSLQQCLRIWNSSINLTAIVSVIGSVRYTVQQYEYGRGILRDAGAEPTWPPYARTHRYFRRIIETCMPQSKLVELPRTTCITTSSTREKVAISQSRENSPGMESRNTKNPRESSYLETEKVRVFFPSAWAELDVATSIVFDEMFPRYYHEQHNPSALERSAIIRDRASITRSCEYIFASSGGNQVQCEPGCEIEISVQSRQPNFQSAFRISALEDGYVLRASIVATWSVGAERITNPSVDRALRIRSLSSQHQAIISSLRTASAPGQLNEADATRFVPGDLLTLLRSENGDENKFPIIVHRFWRYEDDIPSVLLIWMYFPPPTSERAEEESIPLKLLEAHVVENVKLIKSPTANQGTRNPDQGNSHRSGARSYGSLLDGTSFVIYRILLYCDDFQKSSAMHPSGSVGGCYFLPLSLLPEGRRNTSSVRIVSLTPPGVSTNQVLHYIVDDVVNASVNGVNGRNPMGHRVKIFIDVVGFVGDYPASSSVVDVVGHVCRAPCTLCSFRRLKESGTQGSRFGYTTKVHASNSAFMRHGERHNSLRESHIPDEDSKKLGMVTNEKYSDSSCPLLYVCDDG